MSIAEAFYNAENEIIDKRKELKEKFINTPEMTIGDYRTVSQLYPITFEGYQQGTRWSAKFPSSMPDKIYCALGVCGEAGELGEKVKKLFRNNNGEMTDELKDGIKKEIGDVLWYLTALADTCQISMEDVATENQIKLVDRLKRSVLHSEGDNR